MTRFGSLHPMPAFAETGAQLKMLTRSFCFKKNRAIYE